ncbi:MAG: DUF4465 domain-containing protein [Bacteroidales bacterium]|nr:DUF4465 domain-containing protein [Bacteroidales bacterium]
MKQLSLLSKTFALILAITALALPARADRTVNQLQFGKQTIEVAADEVITFLDMNSNQGISSSNSSNSQSLTVFKPAQGMAIQLTFEKLDVRNDGNNWPAYVNVYAGDPDADNSFTYATSTSDVTASSTLPEGKVLEKLDGTYTNKTYTASEASGIISVGYIYRYAKSIDGWKATVKCITLEDMAVTGAASNYDNVEASTSATQGINFATAQVTTTGVMNADAVTAISFKATTNEDAIDPTQLRLYAGSKTSFMGDNALTASVVADGEGYTFNLNQPLGEGLNQYSIAGEFLSAATPGAKAAIEITKIATTDHPDGVTPFTAGTTVAVAKPAIAMISTTPQVITVGDVPYNFYDDGGKDGNITQGFEGQITFVPATEGNAIKIDFSKLELFNTSTVGYNDVFKFYNGREVNEENLITTLLDEPEIVKSTADDGSMTVYFKTVTGYPKSGWEALVSQFLPGNMTLAGVSGEAASTATVSAGDTDAQMLVIDVATDNTANPLSLKGINLTAADAKNISRARAYYLGKKNTFATTDKFGEVEVSGTTIAITGEKELIEGHNYVAIVLDINNGAQNDEQITLSLNDVTVGETTQAPATAVSATRTVNNVCRATQGAHSHVISGPWTFTNTEGYSGKYETVDADYVVTFTPAEAGTVAEIDFSSFDVYYSTSSYSTRAVFEIYCGTEVSADKLLWNLKDNSESKVGPGKVLRSQSADGSLTIRFNPKTTSSYYAGTGWTATVQPFQNHDMSVKNITVNQTSSDVIAVGATGAELIDFNLETEGTLSLMTVKDINLDLKSTQAAISKVSVFYNNTNDRASAVEFGAVENPEASAIIVSGERELAEGNNYWWVNVDIKADAAAESVVDAKLVSIVDAAGTTTTIENGDPEGNRVVKYIYLMQEGNNIVTVTEPLLFYDDGGADGKLTKGFKGSVTFVPGRENSAVQINTLNTFSIGSGKMMIYSGREANEENILGKITGYSTTTGPANLVSKAEDGSMTVVFEANSSASTLDGWEMEVSLHEKTPFTIEAIDVANTTDDVMRNSQDNVMQQIKLNVSGDKDPIALSSVAFNATGNAHIANAKVYYTEHNAVFSTNTLLGSVTVADGENTLSLDEPLEITDNGDYYLWLTYDIATDATVGTAVTAQITKVGDTDVTATAASRTIKAGLKGNYIIGASDNAHYHTFAEATEALQGGVEGAVTFQVEDGTYAENIWFASVPGAGENNTITFTSLSGNRDNVIIAGAGSSEYMPGSSSYKKGVVFIDNTPYVTLDKLSFVPAKESEYSYVVQIYDRSHHFTLSDCHVKATPVLSGYSGINLVKMSAVNEDGRNNDFATFENNLLEGGYIALYLGGTNNVSLSKEQGLVVRGNTISEAGSKGIYIYDEINTVVENNVISQSTVQKTGYWGIDIARNRGNVVVSGNKINNSTTYYSGGIQLRGETFGTPEVPVKVYNNAISIINSPSNSTAGIEIDLDQKYIDVVNNTVRIAGNGGYTFYTARRTPIAYEGIKLQNNLLQNTTSSPAMFIISGYNDKPSMINNALWGETVMEGTTIGALNEMAGNSGNITEQADFMSDVDLHLKSAGNLCMGLPVDYITTDADGLSRNAETPTVGAYEFAEVVEQKPEIAEGYPTVNDVTETTATIKSKWTVGGKLYYKVEEVTTEPAGAPALKVVTAEDLKATEGVDITADTEVSTALADLTPATTYKAYLMVVSALGVESDVVETEQFTTLRHIEPLTATLDKVAATISAGETATITAVVAGGDEPYTYEWRDQMNQVVGNEATLSVAPEYSYGYRLTVTSADGQTVNAKTGVRVLGEAVAASMDDNYLDEDSHWAYDPSTASMITDGFYSGSYYFNNGAMPGYNYWYGYSLSNETSTAYASLADQWHSAVGEGHNGSSNYCVAFPEGQFVEITNSVDGDNLQGVYVSNSAYSFNGMANGDGIARAFKQDDWFKLTAVGFDANNTETARVDFYLADYRSTNSLDHYILDTWQWMDLRPLGKVAKVRFLLDGTDKGNYGLNTAAYFVMDDFNCERDMTQATCVVKLGESTINLRDYVMVDDNGSTMVFTLEDAGAVMASAGAPALKDITTDAIDIALDENGMLNINAKVDLSAHKVLVGLTQQGKTQWVELTVKVDNSTAIDGIIVENGKMVENRQYINVAGQVSDHPFNGLNIIVTRYTDGSTTSVKKIF